MMESLIIVLAAMAFSTFFTGIVFAFTSVDKLRFEIGQKSGAASKALNYFFHHSDDFVAAMLVGKTIALIVYGIFAAQIIVQYVFVDFLPYYDFWVLAMQILLAVLVILPVESCIPQILFKMNPDRTLYVSSFPLIICYLLLLPVAKLITGLSWLLLRVTGTKINKEAKEKSLSKTDLDNFVQSSIENVEDETEVNTEVRIFQNVLDFSNVKVRDCIVPRTEVVGVDVTASLENLKNLFVESGLSKIIVYEGNIDHVVGYIHSSEMFRNPPDWRKNVKQIPIVPETMAAHKLMQLFMQQKKSIAVVVDEFGGVTGIVSLEDLVEEIFGDIEDEHDNTSYICKQVGEHEYVLSARLEIERVNEAFGLNLLESDDYLTIGGLILNINQGFPKLNEIVSIACFHFRVIKMTSTKIELVRLKVVE